MEKLPKEQAQVSWTLIPPVIDEREDLTIDEKYLAGKIIGLTNAKGYCYASNKWLAKKINKSIRTVSRIISSLNEKAIISVEVIRDENKRIIERRIFLTAFTQAQMHQGGVTTPVSIGNDTHDVRGNDTSGAEIYKDKNNKEEIIYTPQGKNLSLNGNGKYTKLGDITPEVVQEIADKYKVSPGFVEFQRQKMENWLEAKGKRYKNYKRGLMNWVLSSMETQIRDKQNNRKGGIVDASEL